MTFEGSHVLMILALALDNSTSDHKIRYLLKKLYGLESLALDAENQVFLLRICNVAKELKG